MVRHLISRGVNFLHAQISHTEYHIHKGEVFTILQHRKLNTAGEFDIHIVIPTGYRAHFTYDVQSALEARMQVFADTTITGGTVSAPRNRDETSSNVSGIVITYDPTITDIGTTLADVTWGTTSTPVVGPNVGGADEDNEFIWPSDAVRMFRITSAADANNIIVRMNFILEKL